MDSGGHSSKSPVVRLGLGERIVQGYCTIAIDPDDATIVIGEILCRHVVATISDRQEDPAIDGFH